MTLLLISWEDLHVQERSTEPTRPPTPSHICTQHLTSQPAWIERDWGEAGCRGAGEVSGLERPESGRDHVRIGTQKSPNIQIRERSKSLTANQELKHLRHKGEVTPFIQVSNNEGYEWQQLIWESKLVIRAEESKKRALRVHGDRSKRWALSSRPGATETTGEKQSLLEGLLGKPILRGESGKEERWWYVGFW